MVEKLGKSRRDKEAGKVSLVLALDSSGRLLLGKRQDNGRWTLPGGHAEPGESPERCAVRETMEETGLAPPSLERVDEVEVGGKEVSAFLARVDGEPTGEGDPDEECREWRFFSVSEGEEAGVWENLHGPADPEQNVVLRFLASDEGGVLAKSERLAKMALVHDDPENPVTVYRVMNERGNGPYGNALGFSNNPSKNRPEPGLLGYGAGFRKPSLEELSQAVPGDFDVKDRHSFSSDAGHLFAFEKPEDARRWFGPKALGVLASQGFEVRPVPASRVWRSTSGRQVFFEPHPSWRSVWDVRKSDPLEKTRPRTYEDWVDKESGLPMRRCPTCHRDKPLEAGFGVHNRRGIGGRRSQCKECEAVYRSKNKERVDAYNASWREKNPDYWHADTPGKLGKSEPLQATDGGQLRPCLVLVTGEGADQVAELLGRLPVAEAYSADVGRTREVAAALAGVTGVPSVPSPDLGSWERGGAESFEEFRRRVLGFFREVMREAAGQAGQGCVLLVVPGVVASLARAWLRFGAGEDQGIGQGVLREAPPVLLVAQLGDDGVWREVDPDDPSVEVGGLTKGEDDIPEKAERRKRYMEARVAESGLPPKVLAAFSALGDAQRGLPEEAMLRAQHAHGGGVISGAIEHTGDLTHRMTHMLGWGNQGGAGYEYVHDKVSKVLRWLRNPYGFGREHMENINNNARYHKREPGRHYAVVSRALGVYADEHSKLPVYNEAQYHAREAAIRLGRQDFVGAERSLARLEPMLVDEATWEKMAREHVVDAGGDPVQYAPPGQVDEGGVESGLKKMAHDYDPSWDYEVDQQPDRRVVELVNHHLGQHAGVLGAMRLSTPTVHYVRGLKDDHLARYVSGTSTAPVIVVDSHALSGSSGKHGVDLGAAVESTLLHEYGHAYLESTGEELEDEEGVVEGFAHHVWKTGDYKTGMEILDGGLMKGAPESLGKMAIADIPVGERVDSGPSSAGTIHDYDHLLPERVMGEGYRLRLHHQGDTLRALLTWKGAGYDPVGHVSGYLVQGGKVVEPHSELKAAHQGKGLGIAMYEAVLAHARSLGGERVSGAQHSEAASRVHRALARKHGLDYRGKLYDLPGDEGLRGAGPYEYALKSEGRLGKVERPQNFSGPNADVWWHGTPSGDLRGGVHGLHVGTRRAAEDALYARIGRPAEGTWDGTREFGKTPQAGARRLREMGVYPTGYETGIPEEDYLPDRMPVFSDGTPMSPSHKPDIFPVRIVGPMTNAPWRPYEDFKANGMMAGAMKRGTPRRGYYYKNVGEDDGSVSAVVPPGGVHLERLPRGSVGNDGYSG